MKPLFAALLRTPARLAVPAAAALAVLGGSAALAAPASAATPASSVASAKFTWHSLKLSGGWKSFTEKGFLTGAPGWALHNGVVYLRGAISQPGSGGSVDFGQLPASERPASDLYLQVTTCKDQPGTLFIGSNGGMA